MKPLLTALALACVAACATTPDSSRASSRNVITAEEIAEVDALTAYQAVERLRPAFLRRGRVNMQEDTRTYPIVYLDAMRFGGIDDLHRIRTADVYRIEYLSGSDATTRFGTGHTGGALLVTTFRAAGES